MRVNHEETLLLINDKNKLKVKLLRGSQLQDTDIRIDEYWKRRQTIEDLEMVGTDKCLVAVSDGSLNLHHLNLVDQQTTVVAREYLNRNSQKSNQALKGKQLQITAISVSKNGKYAVVSTNTDAQNESRLASLRLYQLYNTSPNEEFMLKLLAEKVFENQSDNSMYTFLSFYEPEDLPASSQEPPVILAFQGGDKFALDTYSLESGQLNMVATKERYHRTDFSAIRSCRDGIVSFDFEGNMQIMKF